MQKDTLKIKVASLLRKSRQAVRLYSSLSRFERDDKNDSAEFQDMQTQTWLQVNTELQNQLSRLVSIDSNKRLVNDLFALRDHFYEEWRGSEAKINVMQKESIQALERGDYIRVAVLARSLIKFRATKEASEAVSHELSRILKSCKRDLSAIDLTKEFSVGNIADSSSENRAQSVSVNQDQARIASEPEIRLAKVIPFR